jgi:hypothetical protein
MMASFLSQIDLYWLSSLSVNLFLGLQLINPIPPAHLISFVENIDLAHNSSSRATPVRI